jgi:hypothetical protein
MMLEPSIPPVANIVVCFERALCGERPQSQGRVVSLLLDLHESNGRQWDLEDVTRVPNASDSVVASAKRAIDKLNLARHHLIQEIDAAVEADLRPSTTAPLATETPGMVLDRLSVLVIRIARTAQMARSDSDGADVYGSRLPSLQRQLSALSGALEALLEDVRAGTRCFLPYEHLKLYVPQPTSRSGSNQTGGGGSPPD